MLRKTLLATAVAIVLSSAAVAQHWPEGETLLAQTPGTSADKPDNRAPVTKSTVNQRYVEKSPVNYDVRASDLLGVAIVNAQDKTIGEVDDVLITHDDKVLNAVVSVGGFLGVGDKLVAIPFDQLAISRNDKGDIKIRYNASTEELKKKPAFTYHEGDKSWRERMQERLGQWSDKAKQTWQEQSPG